ncbi:MAG: hypothetical protein KDD42_05070, partial [Bdellovibrionales bacterium]|nr:hypothetical protein [Bdellovibrionales bacterium]
MIIKNLLALANLILFLNYFPHSIRAEVHDMQVERVRALGQPAVSNLMLRLKENLSGALINSGPVGALKFCNSNAEKLKEQTEATLPSGLKLKRTAERVRNPNNAPDQAEKLALE